jgi:hypothetical protein
VHASGATGSPAAAIRGSGSEGRYRPKTVDQKEHATALQRERAVVGERRAHGPGFNAVIAPPNEALPPSPLLAGAAAVNDVPLS